MNHRSVNLFLGEERGEEKAWEISKAVFRWEGSNAIEEHRDQRCMLTSSGMNLVSWGAVMVGEDDFI